MADARISQLPAATSLSSADIVPFSSISASETRKITAGNLALALTQLGTSVGTAVPASPFTGQLWVDTNTNPPVLKVYNGASFTVVSFLPNSSVPTSPANTAPTSPALGQLWLDTSQTPDELKVYDGSAFVRVDPLGITDTAAAAKYLQIANATTTYLALAGGTLTGNLTLTGNPTTANMASNKAYVDAQVAAIPAATDQTPAGTIIHTARTTAPTGYLKANGATVSRSTFSDLFAAIGTQFGAGDGSSTFRLPDLRGEFIRSWSDGHSVDSGRSFGSQQSDQNKSHSHGHSLSTDNPGNHSHTSPWRSQGNSSSGGGGNNEIKGGGSNVTGAAGGHTHSITGSISSDGGTEARPRNVALLACIKT